MQGLCLMISTWVVSEPERRLVSENAYLRCRLSLSVVIANW